MLRGLSQSERHDTHRAVEARHIEEQLAHLAARHVGVRDERDGRGRRHASRCGPRQDYGIQAERSPSADDQAPDEIDDGEGYSCLKPGKAEIADWELAEMLSVELEPEEHPDPPEAEGQ